jgi:hypothetical protein|tara:strand:+ start:11900 stop:12178 length:279 start_codon:yes stop_codon:yes gene_type:complete
MAVRFDKRGEVGADTAFYFYGHTVPAGEYAVIYETVLNDRTGEWEDKHVTLQHKEDGHTQLLVCVTHPNNDGDCTDDVRLCDHCMELKGWQV